VSKRGRRHRARIFILQEETLSQERNFKTSIPRVVKKGPKIHWKDDSLATRKARSTTGRWEKSATLEDEKGSLLDTLKG